MRQKQVDISKFAKKIDLASLKSEIGKLDIDKLETTPVDLTQPANIGPQDVPRTPPSNVPRTFPSNVPRTSPGRPLKILFDHPGDVPI